MSETSSDDAPQDSKAKNEIPETAFKRTSRLASLPVGFAGRKALGLGKKIGGKPAEAVNAQIQAKTAEQLFNTLGQLKGGAMKFGQILSVMEAALPEELAAPYRENLTKLQNAAPPMPPEAVEELMKQELGPDWRDRFLEFPDTPAAAASIGQVHKAVSRDGREVAVKIQYPGAEKALRSDLKQLSRMGRMFGTLIPGLDIKPLLEEMEDRMVEELDYLRESKTQRAFAAAYEGDPDYVVPHVLAAGPHVIVSEWIDGVAMSKFITDGTREQRDHIGNLYFRFLLSGPARAGLLHADPHPGNYLVTPDNKLAILDFGAAAELPNGFPSAIGHLISTAIDGNDPAEVVEGLRAEGFIKPNVNIDPEDVVHYFSPMIAPLRDEQWHFSRQWLQSEFARIKNPRGGDLGVSIKFNLPPQYLLIHRVWIGSTAVLCQLDATVAARSAVEQWVPNFTD